MKYPLDSSDEASFILADYLEEYDDINLANEVRNSVLDPNINNWCWEHYCYSVGSYGYGIGSLGGSLGSLGGYGVGSRVSNDVVGNSYSYFGDGVGGH